MKNYEVGQILYITNSKNMNVIPIQVVEEVIRTTLNGKEKTYIVKFPNKQETLADISDINTQIFLSTQEIEDYMISNTKNAIKKMIEKAKLTAQNTFKINNENNFEQNVQSKNNNNIITVDLGDGTKAKMNLENLNDLKKG